jgi:hypothetical protein
VAAESAQHHEIGVRQRAAEFVRDGDELRATALHVAAHEAARLPHRHDPRCGILQGSRDERLVLAQVRGTIEVRSREDVGDAQCCPRGDETRAV